MSPRDYKSRSKVPPFLVRILDTFCKNELTEEFTGDLEELHKERLRSTGKLRANIRSGIDVISFLRTRFKKQRTPGRKRFNGMLAHSYARVAWRGVVRNRAYAIMNVAGLATGLACCLLIGIYIQDELSYDGYHSEADNIYRVTSAESVSGRNITRASTHVPLAPVLSDEYAAVQSATRVYPYSALVSQSTDIQYQEDGLIFADSTFFDIFTFERHTGILETALDDPYSIVLTESAAKRYFAKENPIGKTLNVQIQQGAADFIVTAVIGDVPRNSHFSFDIVVSFHSMRALADHIYNWHWPPVYTYVALSPGTDPESLQAKFQALQDKYLTAQGLDRSYSLQPVQNIHLRSRLENEISATGDIRYIYVFTIIAGLILLIGSINYMNLSTARSAIRAREAGMRRVLGAQRGQLAVQFLSESMVTTGTALVAALGIARVLLQPFNNLTGKELEFAAVFSGWNPAWLIAVVLVVGLFTGSYPAFFLSSNRASRSMVGSSTGSAAGTGLRKSLVVVQFAITSILIVGTLAIRNQLSFLQNDQLGYNKEHVLVIPLRETDNQINHETIQTEWERDPRILAVAASSGFPGHMDGLHDFMVWPEGAGEDSLEMLVLTTDYDFSETYGLEIVSGRDFSRDFASDATDGFLLNESAARKLGWMDPVGAKMRLEYYTNKQIIKEGQILGVVRDFQYSSLHTELDPIVFHIIQNSYYNDFLSVRISPDDIPGVITHLEESWKLFNPDRPFEYQFVDEVVDQMYQSDVRLASVLRVFSVLAILIACLGLFALAAYTTERRTHEIGVRKIMGASVTSVFLLLSREFMILVFIAFAVAVPFSWFVVDAWLQGFAARVEPGLGIFLFAGLFALFFGILSVGYQSMRAATANPAESLRHE